MDFQPRQRFIEHTAMGQSPSGAFWELGIAQPPLKANDLAEALDLSSSDRERTESEWGVLPPGQKPGWNTE